MTATHLLLTRHGETVWHAENRYAGGSSDIDLTGNGRRQARSLADWARLRHLDAVVSSPIRRAVETATPSAEAIGVALEIVDDLREVDFGLAEGRTAAELRDLDGAMLARFQRDPVAHPFPRAESPAGAALRASRALRAVADRHRGGTVLVVAHNTVLRLALCALLDLPIARYRQLFPVLENAAVTHLLIPADGEAPASLLALNLRHTHHPTEESR